MFLVLRHGDLYIVPSVCVGSWALFKISLNIQS